MTLVDPLESVDGCKRVEGGSFAIRTKVWSRYSAAVAGLCACSRCLDSGFQGMTREGLHLVRVWIAVPFRFLQLGCVVCGRFDDSFRLTFGGHFVQETSQARVPHTSVRKECQARVSYKTERRTRVLRECSRRVSRKSALRKSAPQELQQSVGCILFFNPSLRLF